MLQGPQPEGARDRQRRSRIGRLAGARGPLPQLQQALLRLIAASMAMGQQSQLLVLLGVCAALQLNRGAEGAAFTEAEQRPNTPAQRPGGASHHRNLQAQGQLPAGGMGTGRSGQGGSGHRC